MIFPLLVVIAALASAQADVKHLSKEYLPPIKYLPPVNKLDQQIQKDVVEEAEPKIVNGGTGISTNQGEQPSMESQDPVPFPGPFIPTPGSIGGFGFPNGGNGIPNIPIGAVGNFLPGQLPNFPQQTSFQPIPGSNFQPGFNQPNFGLNRPGVFGQPFQQLQQFGNQGFSGSSPGFQPQQYGGLGLQQPGFQQGFPQPGFQQPGFQQPGFQQPGFQQPGFQQPFPPRAGGAFQQTGFGFDNQLRISDDDLGTVYGSNNGYVYEKPKTKL